ncbi:MULTISPECIES: response regulator transcription factor [Sphingobacterium]|jgi:two-component system OmpR family response regulator|uniref:response regulator transcription factor n=1 Tax=Sphingobacterium TaxID=28453 RepID=UPI00038A1181|nr:MULTISPECIES: response regulator transcription factor [Sphingobacterium]KKX47498.1 transcriptional regulator [Sphingobacterium sp. IITKGP-BTPF85]MCS3553809.1 DNA-binding response OmpR family regulator [Sphingobacterium sp. JUb21]MCW2260633.1 DNA-binding response OmpR family regulator [Sphingobacterium kitahiroshimense]NJI75866.1 response regulator transcription factor [Sphingobacterium sp. B16(2022)]TCR05130.1 DNA-binding response OmpR family regulator [Sphingobacterium sp. JUb20]
MQILVVEDDKRISDFLIKGLEENGYLVTLCRSAEEVIANYLNIAWDLLIIDIMLPGMDGRQLVSTLRYKDCRAPVLMLSALNTVQDKVDSLDIGADDYLTKPFHFDELLSRIKALTRRSQIGFDVKKSQCIQIGSLMIDKDQYKVFDGGQEVELSPREFKLLMYLVENQNKAVSRIQILNAVWGINFDNQTNVVDVYISYVRNKVEKNQKYIFTVKGVGYLFKLEQ